MMKRPPAPGAPILHLLEHGLNHILAAIRTNNRGIVPIVAVGHEDVLANRSKYCDTIFQVAGPVDKIHVVLRISCINKNL